MVEALVLAIGLAMDATAVATARSVSGVPPRQLVLLAFSFGVFQAGMAALGWWVGASAGDVVEQWDHWIAFGLLVGIGLKMLFDAWRGSAEQPLRSGPLVLLGLALATSIDAAAAGITLPLIPVSPWLALVLIGGVTAACSAIGFVVGRTAGRWLGGKLTALGGLILIAIGVRLLLAHL